MPNILPDGGRGTGVNPRGGDYPFVDPSPEVRGVLADAWLAHEGRTAVPPLRLTRLAGFGAAFEGVDARCDVEFRDAADRVVFDSTTATRYRSTMLGARLKAHEWYADTSACRVVQHTAFPESEYARVLADPIVPVDGRLDERAVLVVPRRVVRIGEREAGASVQGDVVLANGYNLTIAADETREDLRLITRLTFAADPGSGLGRYPGCAEPELVLRTINRVPPGPDGDFQLGAEGCYWARQPTVVEGWPRIATPVDGTLRVGNDCGPCCECDDFVRVQRGVLRTWGKFVALAADAEAVRDVFATVVARWREEKECVEAKVVTVALAAFGGQFVEIVAGICNHTRYCLYDTTLVLTVVTAPGPGLVAPGVTRISVPGRGLVAYTLGGDWPEYTAYFDAVQAMTNGALRTRLRFPDATRGSAVAVRVDVTTAAPLAGLQLPQSATAATVFGG
jgi:hypothetical protein